MMSKVEMLRRVHALVQYLRCSPAWCESSMVAELLTLEAARTVMEAELARVIDEFQTNLYKVRNRPPPILDPRGLLVSGGRNRAFVKRLALEQSQREQATLLTRIAL